MLGLVPFGQVPSPKPGRIRAGLGLGDRVASHTSIYGTLLSLCSLKTFSSNSLIDNEMDLTALSHLELPPTVSQSMNISSC